MYYGLCALAGLVFGGFTTFILMKLKFQKDNQEQITQISLLKSQVKLQEDFREIIKNDFTNFAAQTVKEQQEDLRKQNREILGEKVNLLSEKLVEFQRQIIDFQEKGAKNKTEVLKEIENLRNNSQKLSEDAQSLTKSLTMNQNIKGAYGEDLLENILQSAGLLENIHYIKQFHTKSASSKDEKIHNIKPDFVIKLPNEKHLIIDSKLTLTSYLEYQKNQNKDTKTVFLRALRARIDDLSKKNYENAQDLTQPDFILLYMPLENCIGLIYSDEDFSEIVQKAYNSNIIIVGSSSLLTTVRLVNQLWSIQSQCENSNKIAKAGAELYETFNAFCEGLIEIQKKFKDLSGEFSTTINRFSHSSAKHPSLFSRVQILKEEYKINTTKQIPSEFLEESSAEEETSINNQ